MIKDAPTIKRIRDSRHRISGKFDHDPQKIIEYYIEIQKKHKERLLDNEKGTKDSNHVSDLTMT
ncbi:MAG: hypothetical protein MAG551_00136 [Candidatus Scalindua arabica]|uniref:Uncharacterized protein n=1 Tax=Candidatus Scalindua arabica TaxID=1127984 RepID=A0A942A0H7_9BACT|nr:hypothetical protein [Candidatus Scalindua arabica]